MIVQVDKTYELEAKGELDNVFKVFGQNFHLL